MKHFYLLAICSFFVTSYSQIINFPDPNFKAKLLQPDVALNGEWTYITLDANGNGAIEVDEAQQVFGLQISNANISDLTGISFFTGLAHLECNNNLLTSLIIDNATGLIHLNASYNALTAVDVNFAETVEVGINLSHNNLTTYTIPDGYYHDGFILSHNQLTNLTIGNATFDYLTIDHNNLSSITVSGTATVNFQGSFKNNQFTMLDLSDFNFGSECVVLLGDNIVDNVLFGVQPGNIYYSSQNTYCNLGNFSSTTDCDPENRGHVLLDDCPNLTELVLKNGFNHTVITCNEGGDIFQNAALDLEIIDCPNLSFICVDEVEMPHIQTRINQLGLQDQVQVNPYCSFTPGGTYYTISGFNSIAGSSGCDGASTPVPSLPFSISNGSETVIISGNSTGNYNIPVQQGTYSIIPQFENPSWFAVSPQSLTVSFPAAGNSYTQDFCISPVGVHHDLSVAILPSNAAVPGFNANYQLILKNNGNQTASGTLNFSFDDATLDYVSATGAPTVSPSQLAFDFAALAPFHSLQYTIALNLNTPTETPPLNQGDVLTFTATINTTATDETPDNNVATLDQTVMNSFDPNHKTCVEGATIQPSMVGEYVHYIIEFENVGTFPATNVVVKDMIDTAKFDVSTLVPVASSHSYITRITETNKVEFIFKNINLPFDDANNDGFIAFKIKTKPTLVLNDTFSNTASIYFDYNFPIITNTETTTVSALRNHDFDFATYFTIYPNPVARELHIASVAAAEVNSISIYNMLGQQMIVVPNAQDVASIDVSSLEAGTYFIKVATDKGTSATKFIKQ